MARKISTSHELFFILFVMFLFWLICSNILPFLFSLLSLDPETSSGIRFRLLVQSVVMFLLPAIFIYRYFLHAGCVYQVGINIKPQFKLLLLSLMFILLAIPVVSLISFITEKVFASSLFSSFDFHSNDVELKKIYDKLLLSPSFSEICANIFVLSIVPAICEEFFFRGIIQNFMLRNMENKILAILFASVIFSFAHLHFTEFASRTILGFIIGYAYFKGRSLWIPILMHALNNIIAVFFV